MSIISYLLIQQYDEHGQMTCTQIREGNILDFRRDLQQSTERNNYDVTDIAVVDLEDGRASMSIIGYSVSVKPDSKGTEVKYRKKFDLPLEHLLDAGSVQALRPFKNSILNIVAKTQQAKQARTK